MQWLSHSSMWISSRLRSGSALASGQGTISPCACARRRRARPVPAQCRPEGKLDPGKASHEPAAPSVLVVFADHVGCPWLRPLRPGFRHCFAVLRAGSVWLACDPLKDRIELDALELPGNFDLAAFYREQGHRVLEGRRPPPRTRRRFALAPLTCVTVVKRLLSIHAPWVCTPWQLYTHLSGSERGFRETAGATWATEPRMAGSRENAALDRLTG